LSLIGKRSVNIITNRDRAQSMLKNSNWINAECKGG
tara:strand:+ start:9111 stop:9218 length:108 start_codon:yes stop_codon:yes gene_type:complete